MERKVCTIGEWLDVWYEVYAVPEYAPKTLEIYRDARKRLSRRFPEIESTLQSALEFAAYRRTCCAIPSRPEWLKTARMQKALLLSLATPTRPLSSAGTSTRITHPSTSKCAVFQAYSNKPAILPLFKTEKPTHHYRRVGFTFAILCFLCVMNDLVKGIELRFVFCRMIDNFLVKSVFRK